MIIERFGIKLIKLTEEHIELVRTWRNAPNIRQFMEYQDYITEQMQGKWFHSLDATSDFFFLIAYKNESIGMIHASSIDWESGDGNAGLYIWLNKYLSTYIPVLASLAMVDFFFELTTLQKLYAKVMKSNSVAIDYNLNLGFVPLEGEENHTFQSYVLERSAYLKATARLHPLADEVGRGSYEISMDPSLYHKLLRKEVIMEEVAIDLISLPGEVADNSL